MTDKGLIGGLIIDILVGVVLLFVIAIVLTPYYAPPHQANNLCENEVMRAVYGSQREAHGETTANRKDCCFLKNWEASDFSLSGQTSVADWCKMLATSCKDSEDCSLPSGFSIEKNCTQAQANRRSPFYLFDCSESIRICNNETCVMNCNQDGICQEGEFKYCPECA